VNSAPSHDSRDASLARFFGEVWDYREVLLAFIWRDFIIRYKHTRFGLWWAVLQPSLGLLAYSWGLYIMTGKEVSLQFMVALLPYQLVSEVLVRSADCVSASSGLLQQSYFPRIYLPLSVVALAVADLCIAILIVLAILASSGHLGGPTLLALPLWVAFASTTAFGAGLVVLSLNHLVRDVSRATGLMARLLLFFSPVLYQRNQVPVPWRPWFDLNPLSGLTEGFRWSMLGTSLPSPGTLTAAACVTLVWLAVGVWCFRQVDARLADLA